MSLAHLRQMPPQAQRRRCAAVVPQRCWDHLAVLSPRLAGGADNEAAMRVTLPDPGRTLHMRIPAEPFDGDYCLSLDLEDIGAGQLEMGFIIINDLTAPRFNIDRLPDGTPTHFGTAARHYEAELAAMRHGLGPCQVRRGLRMFDQLLPQLEAFMADLGYVSLSLRPLTYHTAVMYERRGFGYVIGRRRMMQINSAFAPGGALARRMDLSTPFRDPSSTHTPRGRSWAIHDGILEHLDGDHSFEMQMFKLPGVDANQHTFALDPRVYQQPSWPSLSASESRGRSA